MIDALLRALERIAAPPGAIRDDPERMRRIARSAIAAHFGALPAGIEPATVADLDELEQLARLGTPGPRVCDAIFPGIVRQARPIEREERKAGSIPAPYLARGVVPVRPVSDIASAAGTRPAPAGPWRAANLYAEHDAALIAALTPEVVLGLVSDARRGRKGTGA